MSEEAASQNATPSGDSKRKDGSISSASDNEEDVRYKNDYPQKGLCLILNFENFTVEENKTLPKRPGTDKDAESLKTVFESIGFEVRSKKDQTCKQTLDWLKKVAKEDHSQRGCFVCAILSHGNEGGFYATDDLIGENYLFEIFKADKCKSLFGKPKLFFIQACRGSRSDDGVTLHSGSAENSVFRIPTEADILCHYSTSPGHVSYRETANGSWFIQKLCEMLKKYWNKKELLHILTLVNHKVSLKDTNEARLGRKEMPCIVSKLTKCLYL